jgi:hypothetical protein
MIRRDGAKTGHGPMLYSGAALGALEENETEPALSLPLLDDGDWALFLSCVQGIPKRFPPIHDGADASIPDKLMVLHSIRAEANSPNTDISSSLACTHVLLLYVR